MERNVSMISEFMDLASDRDIAATVVGYQEEMVECEVGGATPKPRRPYEHIQMLMANGHWSDMWSRFLYAV
jgi:hypothetical protein